MVHKFEFSAKNLTLNACLFLMLEHTNTANGAAETIKEIVAQIKTDDLNILFRMDSGYFDDDIIETTESAGCQY